MGGTALKFSVALHPNLTACRAVLQVGRLSRMRGKTAQVYIFQSQPGLMERLANDGDLIMAEGYVFEFERRGYLKAGAFVPEVVIEHPDLVRSLHEEFVHAGSDVVLAFTYYGHREKLRLIGKEDLLETLNVSALKIAREVADKTGTLMGGNICNTTVYRKESPDNNQQVEAIFKEQIEWAVQCGADFILAETFTEYGEAKIALDCIQKYGDGTPSIVNLAPMQTDKTYEGIPTSVACRQLEDAGANVVGINCFRGPQTILPLVKEIRQACKGPIAAIPVPYRTTQKNATMLSVVDPYSGKRAFPFDLNAHLCGRSEMYDFGVKAKEIGVQVVGVCCGNSANVTRVVAEAYGRQPPASLYSPDMAQHYIFGNDKSLSDYTTKGIRDAV